MNASLAPAAPREIVKPGMRSDRGAVAGLAAFAVVILFIYFGLSDDFYLRVLTITAIFGIVVVPLDLLAGYMGYGSFGQTAFYGAGAYIIGDLTVTHAQMSFWVSIVVAAVICGVLGFLLSFPLFRLSGVHFAIGTLGLAQLASLVFNTWEWFSGGKSGSSAIPRPEIGGFVLYSNADMFLVVASFLLLTCVGSWLVVRSRIGRALSAIRQDEVLAKSRGLKIQFYKRFAFTFAAIFAGIAGALYAPVQGAVDPGSFTINVAMLFVLVAIMGGSGTLVGPAVGALVYFGIDQGVQSFAAWNPFALGVLLIFIILFFPAGLWGAVRLMTLHAAALVHRWRGGAHGPGDPGSGRMGQPR